MPFLLAETRTMSERTKYFKALYELQQEGTG